MKNVINNILKSVYHWFTRISKWKKRIGLKATDFSIISNNCTGGYVYQYFGISYRTPTEGIGLSVDDYLKLIQRPKYYFTHKLRFVEPSTTERYRLGEHFIYPAAVIDDITVYFRHYPTREEAEEKWTRRSSRINYDKLIFLLTESETMRDEHVSIFENLIGQKQVPGILLTTQNITGAHTEHVDNVPLVNGVPQWMPEIILTSVDWKKVINSL